MRIELSTTQRDLLLYLVDMASHEIGPEIRHTDSREYRQELRRQRVELRELHRLLSATPANTAGGMVGVP